MLGFGKSKRQRRRTGKTSTRQVRKEVDRIEAENDLARVKNDKTRIRAEAKVGKVKAKALSTYAAAEKNRLNQDWRPKDKSADQAVIPDMRTLNARARMAIRDDWAAKSGRGGYIRHVVGIGITPRPNARDPQTNDPLAEYNTMLAKLWDRWQRDPNACDIEKRKDFLGTQRLIAGELFSVGECLVLPVFRNQPGNVGMTVQLIEPEQLDTTVISHDGREVRGGVEVDEFGAAVAYHVYTNSHPLETVRPKSTRIEAERVFHVIDPDRIRQTRGATAMTAVLKRLWHLGMYDEYELIAKKGEACIGLSITEDPARQAPLVGVGGGTGETGVDSPTKQNQELNFEPFMVLRPQNGERVDLLDPKRPGGTYEPYTRIQVSQSAAGMGSDYATVARDYSKGNFASQRQGLIETWDETDPIQTLLINLALRGIWEAFVTTAVLEGLVEAPKFFSDPEMHEAYLQADWGPPPKRWIDPAKQAAAAKILLEAGLASRQRILNELGMDWKELLQEAAEYKKLADELGLKIAGVNAPAKTSPSEPRPTRRPDGTDEDDEEPEDDDEDGLSAAIVRTVMEYAEAAK